MLVLNLEALLEELLRHFLEPLLALHSKPGSVPEK